MIYIRLCAEGFHISTDRHPNVGIAERLLLENVGRREAPYTHHLTAGRIVASWGLKLESQDYPDARELRDLGVNGAFRRIPVQGRRYGNLQERGYLATWTGGLVRSAKLMLLSEDGIVFEPYARGDRHFNQNNKKVEYA